MKKLKRCVVRNQKQSHGATDYHQEGKQSNNVAYQEDKCI